MKKNMTCQIFVEKGLKGTENQCLALAHVLGVTAETKHPEIKVPWKWFAPRINIANNLAYKNSADLFSAPFPDILIVSGRKSISAALEVKKRSKGKTFIIQIMNPRIPARHFDLVIAPEHDGLADENVINIKGALHKLSPDFLSKYHGTCEETLAALPAPRIAVLIGGNTSKSEFTSDTAKALGKDLAEIATQLKGSLMITASRRTGDDQEKILRHSVQNTAHHFWDGQGDNPYFDYLKAADYIICTNDSVSMLSEAIGTEKPTFVANIGTQGRRIEEFNRLLIEKDTVKPISKMIEGITQGWQPQVSSDMMSVISEIKKRYAAHTKAVSGE